MGRDFWLPRYASPNLNRVFKEAGKLEKSGAYMDAARIYKDVSEAIGAHMDLIPDKGGYCYHMMLDAIEGIVGCVLAAELDDARRREEIRYMAEWSMRVIDWFVVNYGDALSDMCQDVEDLDLWESVLNDPPKVEDDYSGPSSYGTEELRKRLEERRLVLRSR